MTDDLDVDAMLEAPFKKEVSDRNWMKGIPNFQVMTVLIRMFEI